MRSRIAERKLIHWVVGYLAVAWILLEATGEVSGIMGWPEAVQRVVFILLLYGLPAVIVVAWFHGEKGRQEVTRLELWLLGAITALAGVSAYGFAAPRSDDAVARPAEWRAGGIAVDTALLAVLPFRYADGVDAPLDEDIILHDALSRWRGLALVDPMRVREAVAAFPDRRASTDADHRLALELGAGRFLTGEALRVTTGLRLRLVLHDVGRRAPLTDTAFVVPEGVVVQELLARGATTLLFRAAGVEGGRTPGRGTRSFPAAVAFQRGIEAVGRWELATADEQFTEAARLDPDFAAAHLWRAQAAAWDGTAVAQVLPFAERAAAAPAGLSERERLLAAGLVAMAREQYPAACQAYDALRRADDRDFAAWFGLGECRARDPIVVRDASSPSGWAFRGGYHSAMEAYRRAYALQPGVFRAWVGREDRPASLLQFTTMHRIRLGRGAPPDSLAFAARPAILADTLAFTPIPLGQFSAGGPGARPATHWAAVERRRVIFRQAAESWVAAFPESSEAREALALALAVSGETATHDAWRNARLLTTDPDRRRRLAADEVLSILRFAVPDDTQQLRRAVSLADTVLAAAHTVERSEARKLAVLAIVTGRVHRAAALARLAASSESWPVRLPAGVMAPARALLVYAALGEPEDSIRAYEERVEVAIRNRLPSGDQAAARSFLLDRPASLAFATHPLRYMASISEAATHPVLFAQAAYGSGDSERALAIMDSTWHSRERLPPSDRNLEVLFPEAWLVNALGHPLRAAAELDATLSAVRWMEPTHLLHSVAPAAALGRAMALRAEIAYSTGDVATAVRWARAVTILWSDADAVLAPAVERMRTLGQEGQHRPVAFDVPEPDEGRVPWQP